MIRSSIDQSDQPCFVIVPDGFAPDGKPVPLFVSLHSWSGGLEQRKDGLEVGAAKRGWIYLFPNFRGRNDNPDACGSLKAQQDILDAVDWAKKNYPIDSNRIYLAGASGGGHMTMLMAGRHPDIWAAASAWVGISDLEKWHAKHVDTKYGAMIRKSCGGAPGDSEAVDREFRERSPITHLHRAGNVAIDIATGIHDGYTGSVPIRHSLEAFNAIASANKSRPISVSEIEQLSKRNGRLTNPMPGDVVVDATFDRAIYLRRTSKKARVTVFEGGHERIDSAILAWLERHVKE